eukprot:15363027-Heterocapsa_arctica.AAC.1
MPQKGYWDASFQGDQPVGQRTPLGHGRADGREERIGGSESNPAEAEECRVQLAGNEGSGKCIEECQGADLSRAETGSSKFRQVERGTGT